jgi:hypothetical protein
MKKKIDDTEIIMAAIQFKRETGYVVRLNNQPLLISDFPELEDLLDSPIENTKPASQLTTDSISASSFNTSPNTADNNTSQIQKALSFCLLFIGITAWIFSTVAVGAASGHNPGSIGEVFICLSVITISSCFVLSLVDRLRYKDPINNYFSLKNIFTIYAVTLLFFYPVHVSTKKNATTGVKEPPLNQLTDQREAPQESMVEENNQISNVEQLNTQPQIQVHGDWVIREYEHNETIDAYTLAEDETLFGTVCFKLSKECHVLYSQSHFTCELGKKYQYIFKTNNGFASSNTATCANENGALTLLNNPETMLSNLSGVDQFTISIVGYSKSTFSPKGYKEAAKQLKQFF